SEQQSHAELGNPVLVEHLDPDARLARDGGGPRREFTRRQRVPRLVRQLAREIAAFPQDPALRYGCGGGLLGSVLAVGKGDHEWRRGGGRWIGCLVAAAREFRQRQSFGSRLRQRRDVPLAANHKSEPAYPFLPGAEPGRRRQLSDDLSHVPGRPPAADQRDAPRPPAPIDDGSQEQVVALRLKLFRLERARKLATCGAVETRHGAGRFILE